MRPAPTADIYTLSLHDALPIFALRRARVAQPGESEGKQRRIELGHFAEVDAAHAFGKVLTALLDRKSTRLNSSHSQISYAVFSLKKKIGASGTRSVAFTPA